MNFASPVGALTVLDDINFTVQRRESVAIVGASGSGKSTLLALLAGLETPSSGRCVLAGHDLGSLDEDGRARVRRLHPLCFRELGRHFDLARALHNGLLPSVYFSDDPQADLDAYSGAYLQQEIAAEGATRNVPAFGRFLRVAALCNGTVVNFTAVANDAQVPRTTVYEYFRILEDTLLLEEVPAWRASRTRKPLVSSKYYFFDVGVAGQLQGRLFRLNTPEAGQALETYIAHELFCYRDYVSGEAVQHWRSASGFEVDFLLGGHTAIEVKAKRSIGGHDLRSLHAIREERGIRRLLCVTLESRVRKVEGIEILPLTGFLESLWSGEYD